jgi:hypothetical protein
MHIVKSTGAAVKEKLAFRQTLPVKWLTITSFILNYMASKAATARGRTAGRTR